MLHMAANMRRTVQKIARVTPDRPNETESGPRSLKQLGLVCSATLLLHGEEVESRSIFWRRL
jgi:hypothetical protein